MTEDHDGSALSAVLAGDAASDLSAVLESVVAATSDARAASRTLLDRFLSERSPATALAIWLSATASPGAPRAVPSGLPRTVDELARLLSVQIGLINEKLNRQVNAILHHPRFQQLEASWRGLRTLVEQAAGVEKLKIRVLSVAWKELARDLDRAIEFDQSTLFRRVYSEQFDMPGGEPFGLLLGDYEVRLRPDRASAVDDMAALASIAQVAAAAFAPFVAAAHPALLGIDAFRELELSLNLDRIFDQPEYVKWRRLRDGEDSRFLGLTIPRILARTPYDDESTRVDGFPFREELDAPGGRAYLWGTAVYAFGSTVIRAFADSGWFAGIRGVGRSGGGLVEPPAACWVETDRARLLAKRSTDVVITDLQEKQLSEMGFIPLCAAKDDGVCVFYGNQSVQRPKQYDRAAATANARLSAMVQYMLCVARFAHYMKVMVRDKVGSFIGADDCQDFLHRWLLQYTTGQDDDPPEVKARFPLREANVQVREIPGKPGKYQCVTHLRPHFQLDQVVSAVRLATEVPSGRPA